MGSSTTRRIGKEIELDHLQFYSEEKIVDISMGSPIVKNYNKFDAVTAFKMLSDEKKVLIFSGHGLLHIINDTLGQIIKLHEKLEEVHLVFIYHIHASIIEASHYRFLFKVLDDLGIKYTVIVDNKIRSLHINNFYTLDAWINSTNPPEKIFNLCQKYIKNKDVKPHRKVYLSRVLHNGRNIEHRFEDGLVFDNRVKDENILEEYLSSLGFEIIIPDHFEDFEDQINFMYEVKTLVSVTSSGLTNAIFMQPGGTVIEFVTPLLITMGMVQSNGPSKYFSYASVEEFHNLYNVISANKNHTYISHQNFNKDASEIINNIESNESLKKIICEI